VRQAGKAPQHRFDLSIRNTDVVCEQRCGRSVVVVVSPFERLGLSAALASKIARQDNGAGVLEHLLRSHGRDIGFGAVTEIIVFKDNGVRLVGPLPAEIQNYTSYAAAPMSSTPNIEAARAFVAFLGSSEGKAILDACGIEPA
jgi:molybdate transport system substrate-binding protein